MEKTQQHESVVEQSGIHCRITNVMGGGVNIWFDRGLRVPSSRRSRNDRLHFNHFNLFRCRNFFFIILFIGKLRLNNDQILIPILPRRLDECVQTAAVIRPTTRWNRIMSTIPNIPKFIRKRSKFNTRACRRSGGHELVSLHALKESNGLWLHEFERREPKKMKKIEEKHTWIFEANLRLLKESQRLGRQETRRMWSAMENGGRKEDIPDTTALWRTIPWMWTPFWVARKQQG